MNRPAATLILLTAAMALACQAARAAERFPPPQFEAGHEMPSPTTPSPRAEAMEYVDLAALVVALSVAAWLALKTRSRRMMFVWMLVCLAYFGFYRKGCVCPIGAIQNVALGIFDAGYAVPLTIVAFFAVFHGHAHGTELPEGQSGLLYSMGFVIATGCLHGVGIGIGLIHRWTAGRVALRIAGALVVIAGLFFLWRVAG